MRDNFGNDKSSKARLRWKILRAALLGKTDNSTCNEDDERVIKMASIHSFPGFCLLERRKVDNSTDFNYSNIMINEKENEQYELLEYKVPIRCKRHEEWIVIRTREKRDRCLQARVNIRSLVSERFYGVDNTSNVKVWDSEGVLTFCMMRRRCLVHINSSSLLSSSSISLDYFSKLAIQSNTDFVNKSKVLRVIELGCGMAGIAGLAMACLEHSCRELYHDVQLQVVLTDGHPDAVKNNAICASLTTKEHSLDPRYQQNVTVRTLLWNESQEGANECAQLTHDNKHLFQLLLVSDCLHFVSFHVALACTIGRLMDVNGLAILCQPCRGKSLEQFMLLIRAMNGEVIATGDTSTSSSKTPKDVAFKPLFEINLLNEYDEVVTNLHHRFISQHEGVYQPATHYPMMLLLRKLRHFDEMSDARNAILHVQNCAASDTSK